MAVVKTGSNAAAITIVQIVFEEHAPAGGALLKFDDPQAGYAAASTKPARPELLDGGADLTVLLVAEEAAARNEWVARGREWIKSPGSTPGVRISLEDEAYILFRPGQAMIVAPAEELESLLLAVVDFAHYEMELRKLEGELGANWEQAQRHLSLIHTVTAKVLRATEDVNGATQSAMMRRMRYARLEPHMVLPPERFTGSARLAAKRLRGRGSVEARLEAADAQIECYEDIYDMANQRRGEYVNFIREYKVEWYILIVLLIELVVIALDFYVHLQEYKQP
jgi:hypothetical protein